MSVIDSTCLPSKSMKNFSYKTNEWDIYRPKLKTNLTETATALTNPSDNVDNLKHATNQLFEAINRVLKEVASPIKLTPHPERW